MPVVMFLFICYFIFGEVKKGHTVSFSYDVSNVFLFLRRIFEIKKAAQDYLLTTGAQEVFEIPPTELTMLSAPNQTRDTL